MPLRLPEAGTGCREGCVRGETRGGWRGFRGLAPRRWLCQPSGLAEMGVSEAHGCHCMVWRLAKLISV